MMITPIVMPKWGLSMSEGTVTAWLVDEGAAIEVGTPILEVETDKIANAVEAPDPGLLRRRIAQQGDTLLVKALLGVMAPPEVSDAEIDAYVAAYVVPAADEADEEAAPAHAFAEVDGIRIRYARRGDAASRATPVLFLHGFGGDMDNWLFNLDAVAESAPVIVLDLPGHGQSDARLPGDGQPQPPLVPGESLEALAGFVVKFLDHLDVERVHAVGHSLGAAIAAQLALDAPGRVASLVLISPAGLGDEIDPVYTQGFVAAKSRRELKPVLERLFADPSLVSRTLIDDVLKFKRVDGVDDLLERLRSALFADGRQAAQPGRRIDAQRVRTLVLWGRDDQVIPAAQAANAPAGAVVNIFEGAGHMLMLEKAGEVNARLKAHIGG
jgi:pyruvate dehydrogenase E2 component (dihydrolipoamide acetyltransferase)